MRILVYLEQSKVRGGIEVFAERHIMRLRAEGNTVELCRTFDERLADDCDEIVIHKCCDISTLERFPHEKSTYFVHDHEPICPRGYAYTPFGRNCTRAGGLWPCIFCAPACRSWKAALGRVLSQRRRIRAMSKFRRIVVISEFMKARLVANGLPAERISVEPPKIEVGNSIGECGEAVDLLYVGQLVRGKGVHLLLRAMARMKRRRTLDIVGTGNMESELKSIAERLGLCDRVRFRGFQADSQIWMQRAACVVVPSFWQEPYGLVAAEAVALKRNVVAFAVGGLPEACQGAATLVPAGDVDALAEALDNV